MLGVSARRLLLGWILCPWRIANNNSDADVRPTPPDDGLLPPDAKARGCTTLAVEDTR